MKNKILTLIAIIGTLIAYITVLYGLFTGKLEFILFSIFWVLINNIQIKIS